MLGTEAGKDASEFPASATRLLTIVAAMWLSEPTRR